jgi:hypothetical protein
MVNITQLRRLVFIKTVNGTTTTFSFEPDDLGQDTIMSINIAPRKKSRTSSYGTTNTPIKGTLDNFSGSISFLLDNFKNFGKALNSWNQATYVGADANAGNIIGDASDFCGDGDYFDVIAQGVCDDGSSVDIELTRCIPSVDDDIEFGTSETTTVTLNLNPIIYNASLHSTDGYPAYSYRLGDKDLTVQKRLNAVTGQYVDVSES